MDTKMKEDILKYVNNNIEKIPVEERKSNFYRFVFTYKRMPVMGMSPII